MVRDLEPRFGVGAMAGDEAAGDFDPSACTFHGPVEAEALFVWAVRSSRLFLLGVTRVSVRVVDVLPAGRAKVAHGPL